MISNKANLSTLLFDKKKVEMVATRQGYGEGVCLAGENDERVVVLCADLTESTRSVLFREKFPGRFIEIGVAEQALVTVASGMANFGKVPFISSYAAFSPGRNWEQIRTTVCLNDVPVKIVGAHAGISVGPDGGTHQALEDVALMRVLPNMVVVVPCDYLEAKKATMAISNNGKPSYLRLFREKTPIITTEDTPFEIGRAEVYWESRDPQVTIVSCGPLVFESIKAANELSKKGIDSVVINSHTIKPLDVQTILSHSRRTGCVVSVEEHQVAGGLGGAVCEMLAQYHPVPMEFVGVLDRFGQSGEPAELMEEYKLTSQDIVLACMKVIKRKNEL